MSTTGKSQKKAVKPPKGGSPNDRRQAAYWLKDDNLVVLTGLALQCRTLDELAKYIGVAHGTLRNWRTRHEEIRDAIDVAREEADAAVIFSTFTDAVKFDGSSRRLWWQYRIAAKEAAYAGKQYGVQEVDDAPIIIINRKGAKKDE